MKQEPIIQFKHTSLYVGKLRNELKDLNEKKRLEELFEKTQYQHKYLGKWIFEAFHYVDKLAEMGKDTLQTWQLLDRMAETFVRVGVIAEKPYYRLDHGWFRALTAQIITKNLQSLDDNTSDKLKAMYSKLNWDLDDAVNQTRLSMEQTHTKFLINYKTGKQIYLIRVVPKHDCPVDSYWKSAKGEVWRVAYHPKNDVTKVFIENQDGHGAIAITVKSLLNWERVER